MLNILQKYRYPILLVSIAAILLLLVTPEGFIFGSNLDWLSQHVSIADHLRKSFWETGSLFLDYSSLGAGTNIYDFAYYGFLRPDVLISYLLPTVSMKTIIISYSVLGVISSVVLCYFWLYRQGLEPFVCFISSFLFLCASCFFQAHRQIMFVNYMPFLLLAFYAIDYYLKAKKIKWVILSFFMIFLHSFYFSIACIAVCVLYFYWKRAEGEKLLGFFLAIALAIGLAAILLLPTGLAILSNAKDAGQTSMLENLSVNIPLSSLLFSPYGCGLTLIALYSIILGIREKATRRFSLVLFSCFFFKIISFLLNGTLYSRDKILIPFLPLVILLCGMFLEKFRRGEMRHSVIGILVTFVFAVPWAIYEKNVLIFLDAVFLLVWVLLTLKRRDRWRYLSLCVIPPLLFIKTNLTDDFVSSEDISQNVFSQQELKSVYQDVHSRFDFLSYGLSNVNYLPFENIKKSSMYSSTTNTLYSQFFYDIMHNPISINNRVALIPGANPFFHYLMGVKYIQSTKEALPWGYEILQQKGDEVLVENSSVLPTVYGSTNLFSETEFDKLSYPYTMDTITNNTVVPKEVENDYTSKAQETTLIFDSFPYPETVTYHPQQELFEVHNDETANFTAKLQEPLKDQILMISFHIQDLSGKGAVISINGIKNKLSAKTAPYPNQNYTFTYFVSSPEEITELSISLSKGDYQIHSIDTYLMDADEIKNPGVLPFTYQQAKGNEIVKGTIEMDQDGYLVTSLPYQKGFKAYVDGKEVPVEVVNKAFVGFELEQGEHDIRILFHPPGKTLGLIVSGVSLVLVILVFIKERRRHGAQTSE